jgi:hypothetical protein
MSSSAASLKQRKKAPSGEREIRLKNGKKLAEGATILRKKRQPEYMDDPLLDTCFAIAGVVLVLFCMLYHTWPLVRTVCCHWSLRIRRPLLLSVVPTTTISVVSLCFAFSISITSHLYMCRGPLCCNTLAG